MNPSKAIVASRQIVVNLATLSPLWRGTASARLDRAELSGVDRSKAPERVAVRRQHLSFRSPLSYFHDGSAATLEALLRERGAVHGMAMSTQLTDAQIADLTAFLETLLTRLPRRRGHPQITCAPPPAPSTWTGMSTPSHDSPRRRSTRSACGLALVLALALGTTGCAHQLTNADLAVGALAVAAVVAVSIVTPSPWCPCAASFSCPTPSWTSEDQVAHPIPPVLSTRPHATAGR